MGHRLGTVRCSRSILLGLVFLLGFLLPALTAAVQPRVADARRPNLARIARGLPLNAQLRLENLALDEVGKVGAELRTFRVFAEDAKVMSGNRRRRTPRNVYLRGSIDGFPGSLAVLSIRERGGIGGFVLLEGEFWTVRGRAGRAGLKLRRVDLERDFQGDPFSCMTDDLAPLRGTAQSFSRVFESRVEPNAPGAPSYAARVAVETDWEFLDLFNGNQVAATDYVGDLFAFASSIYENEVDTSLEVGSLQFWPGDIGSDPWTTGDDGGSVSCSGLFYEFRDYWRANRGNIERATAHFLSGKRTGCGIAYVGALCTDSYGYGMSGSLNANFNATNPVPPVWDIIVVSHEIGHNFNSPHTHCYNGIPDDSYADPVDPCYTANGCYSGPTDLPDGCPGAGQGCGTIMSYCHLRSGGYGNIAMTFGGSVLDGSSHTYGVFPERVPARMHDYVLSKGATGCLDPVANGPTLAVSKSGSGAGRVTSDDGGIDCGTDCSETYADGAEPTVVLTATADDGSEFVGWSGHADCSDAQVTLIGDVTCTASFDEIIVPTHLLTVHRSGPGGGTVTSSPSGIDCGADCTQNYDEGTLVSLTATPDEGSLFDRWTGDCSGTTTGVDVLLDADHSCTAEFSPSCGNGVIDPGEVCDGSDLGGETCGSSGCDGGVLLCNASCDGFDYGECTGCDCDGDGICELGEDCAGCPSDCASGLAPGASCGNGVCEAGNGEDCVSCAADCYGLQTGKPGARFCCGDGDGQGAIPDCEDAASVCNSHGYSCTTTPNATSTYCCGTGGCEAGESCDNCSLDCTQIGEVCGDGIDNDCNGFDDCTDPACLGDPDYCPECRPKGDVCNVNDECCSGRCEARGKSGKKCR